MKKFVKNQQVVEHSIQAFACDCKCQWNAQWCSCYYESSSGSDKNNDTESYNENLRYQVLMGVKK